MKTLEIPMSSLRKPRGYRGLTRQSYNTRREGSPSTDSSNKALKARPLRYIDCDNPWGQIWGPFIQKKAPKICLGLYMSED